MSSAATPGGRSADRRQGVTTPGARAPCVFAPGCCPLQRGVRRRIAGRPEDMLEDCGQGLSVGAESPGGYVTEKKSAAFSLEATCVARTALCSFLRLRVPISVRLEFLAPL